MRRGLRVRSAWLLGLAAFAAAAEDRARRLTDLDGVPRDPFEAGGAPVVLLFVQPECPISNRYAPELLRLAAEYDAAGVRFFAVYAGDVAPEAAREHHAAYIPGLTALLDPAAETVAEAGVEVTPEAALFLPDGTLAYRGRIDDRYVSFGVVRSRPTRRDLAEALDAVLEGRTPEVRETTAIGCFLVRQ